MYRSSLPRTSPLINKVDVMMPPEGCTTSAVSPATLRTTGCSTRGAGVGVAAGVGASAAGAAGFESSGLRHIFSPNRKLRSHKAGVPAKQPGEDGNLRTIVRREAGERTPPSQRVSNQIREGRSTRVRDAPPQSY